MTCDMEIQLPSGKLGVVLKGTPAVIKGFKNDSPLIGQMKSGYFVESLCLSDGTVFEGLSADELGLKLKEHSNDKGRKLLLKPPTNDVIMWSKESAPPADLSPVSSLKNLFHIGYVVDKSDTGSDTGTAVSEEETKEIEVVLTSRLPQSDGTTTIKSIALPKGKLGLSFKESKKTSVSRISETSPMKDLLQIGDVVETLKYPDDTTFKYFTYKEFAEALNISEDIKGRAIIVKRIEDSAGTITLKSVQIPDGKLGVTFKGAKEVYVSRVDKTSAMKDLARIGDVIDTLELRKGERHRKFDMKELGSKLEATKKSKGRSFVIKRTEGETEPETFTNVDIPEGSLGISFKGSSKGSRKVYLSNVSNTSPMKHLLKVGKVIDTLVFPDGTRFRNFDSTELGEKINDTSDMKGRVIVMAD